jgi:FtsH-binding integral membrane protein
MFSGNTGQAHAAYWGYTVLWGLMMAPMIAHYLAVAPALVFRAFLVTAVTFGATSLFGYVTKRSLVGFGAFFMVASIGIIVALVVNMFMASTLLSLGLSIVTVLLFAGVTAWETQMIKDMYYEGDTPGVRQGKSIFGAYALYGSFVTLFVHILNIFGIMGSSDN